MFQLVTEKARQISPVSQRVTEKARTISPGSQRVTEKDQRIWPVSQHVTEKDREPAGHASPAARRGCVTDYGQGG